VFGVFLVFVKYRYVTRLRLVTVNTTNYYVNCRYMQAVHKRPPSAHDQYSRSCRISLSYCHNGSLVTLRVLSFFQYHQVLFSLAFSVLVIHCCENFYHHTECDACFSAPFHEIIPAWNFESHTQMLDRWAPWKAANHSKNLVQELQFQTVGVCRKFLGGAGINHYQLLFVQEQNK